MRIALGACAVFWAGLAAGLCAHVAAHALEQDAVSAAARGQSVLTYDFTMRTPAKDRPAMIAAAKAVTGVVMATPQLSDLSGVAVNGGLHGAAPLAGLPATAPYIATGPIILRWIRLPIKAKADAQGRYEGEGEGPTLVVSINSLYVLPGVMPPAAASETFALPLDMSDEDGVMRFRQGGWEMLVAHKPGVSPFVHATREELLTRAMSALTPDAPNLDDKRRARIRQKYDVLAEELASLGPDERAAPGCENGRIGKAYSRSGCDVPGAYYIVRYNTAYFDPKLGRTTPQIVSIRVRDAWVGGDFELGARLRAAFAELDVAALKIIVK